MKVNVTLSASSFNAAAERIKQAKDNLNASSNKMARLMAESVYSLAIGSAPVCTGDLKRNLQQNASAISRVSGTPEHEYRYAVIADVAATTPGCRYRPKAKPEKWKGEHYARTAEEKSGRPFYMANAVADVRNDIPGFVAMVTL